MVTSDFLVRLLALALAVEETVDIPLERLDPPRRAAVMMAILGLVLTGVALVACVMIGGRWVRRMARDTHGPTTNTMHIENKRLRAALEPILPTTSTPPGETTVSNRKSNETVADS
jgi:hypothetical protein